MIWRTIVTVLLIIIYQVLTNIFEPYATLQLGAAAGRQFAPSDLSYLTAIYTFSGFKAANVGVTMLAAVTLLTIWYDPVKKWIKGAMMLAAFFILLPTTSEAYFDKTDVTEAYTILPNESAFWIPDAGNNKDSQAQLDSEDYLKANKLAVKRFIIPHAKLGGTGGFMGWDSYVPSGRLIIVDRTPFSHEWVDADDRGSSKKKEGFPCQTKEGLNIVTGVSIGTSVTETDAPKFLYNFGVSPPKGSRNDPQIIFTSVYYGRSLFDVMNDYGRKRVQTLVCDEIGKRTFDQANAEMIPIMDSVQKRATDYFRGVGITLNFIGWGDNFEFDKPIQEAVNRAYIAKVDKQIAELLTPYVNTIQGMAVAESFRTRGVPAVPTTVVGPMPDFSSLMQTFFSAKPAVK